MKKIYAYFFVITMAFSINVISDERASYGNCYLAIYAQWNKFECEFIPNEIVDLKVAELNQEKEDRKSENIF